MSTKTEPVEVPVKPKQERDPEKLAKVRGGPQCRTCLGWRPYPSGVACPLCSAGVGESVANLEPDQSACPLTVDYRH